MKNLTYAEKCNTLVTFTGGEFAVLVGTTETLLGFYPSKDELKQALAQNGIKDAKFTGPAANKYLANYGNPVF